MNTNEIKRIQKLAGLLIKESADQENMVTFGDEEHLPHREDQEYCADCDSRECGCHDTPMFEAAYVPSNIAKFAKERGLSAVVNKAAKWAEKAGKGIVGGTAIGKNYSTLVLDLTHNGGEIHITDGDYSTPSIKVNGIEVDNYNDFVDVLDSNEDDQLNEDHEVFMASSSLEQIAKAAEELMAKMGEGEKDVPAWIQDHISKAQVYIQQANEGFYFAEDEDHEPSDETEEKMSLSAMMEDAKNDGKKQYPNFANPLEGFPTEYKELLKKLQRSNNSKERESLTDKMNVIRKKLNLKPLKN